MSDKEATARIKINKLAGKWKGYRSSRLNEKWRVIYKIIADALLVRVVRVTPHDYRRT